MSERDIYIAHRVPSTKKTNGPQPIICKLIRRPVKEEILTVRQDKNHYQNFGLSLDIDPDVNIHGKSSSCLNYTNHEFNDMISEELLPLISQYLIRANCVVGWEFGN